MGLLPTKPLGQESCAAKHCCAPQLIIVTELLTPAMSCMPVVPVPACLQGAAQNPSYPEEEETADRTSPCHCQQWLERSTQKLIRQPLNQHPAALCTALQILLLLLFLEGVQI